MAFTFWPKCDLIGSRQPDLTENRRVINGELKEDNHLHNIGTRGTEGKPRKMFAYITQTNRGKNVQQPGFRKPF